MYACMYVTVVAMVEGKPIRESRKSSPQNTSVFTGSAVDIQQLQSRLEDLEQRACQGMYISCDSGSGVRTGG